MLLADHMIVGETVGEFIWRTARDRILTEEYTDDVGRALGFTLAQKMPLGKLIPWVTIFVWAVDRALPEYGMLALRRVLGVVGLIDESDPTFHIPGIDPPLLLVLPDEPEPQAPEPPEGNA